MLSTVVLQRKSESTKICIGRSLTQKLDMKKDMIVVHNLILKHKTCFLFNCNGRVNDVVLIRGVTIHRYGSIYRFNV